MSTKHTPGLLLPLTPAAAIMRLTGRLTPERITLERRIADGVRARECRAALLAEFPASRACKRIDDCSGYDGWCEDCLRWDRVRMLNARINARAAIAKAEGTDQC